jgi:hypothetical protein
VPSLRVACVVAGTLPLIFLPVGDAAMYLALFVALDAAAVALVLSRLVPRRMSPRPVVALGEVASLALFRRTVPELRGRRPAAIIDAQVAWRQAAEYRRRRRGTGARGGR